MSETDDLFFGQIALKKGYISKDMLGKALRYQQGLAVRQPLGEILLEKGILNRAQVHDVITIQRSRSGRQQAYQQQGSPQQNHNGHQQQQYNYNAGNRNTPHGGIPRAPSSAMFSSTVQRGNRPTGAHSTVPVMNQGVNQGVNQGAYNSGAARAVSPSSPPKLNADGVDETLFNDKGELDIVNRTIGGCQVTKKIGKGGMGLIYLARHQTLNKEVVIKILPPKAATTKKNLERFLREARAAAKLEHPNIVQVLNVNKSPEGLYYITMQYIDGVNLKDYIMKQQKVPWKDTVTKMIEVSKALKLAHASGIIHRDIKAENILVDRSNTCKVADFGLAKDLGSNLKLTADGAFIGTPLYMAPEIGRVPQVDGRVDIFSLGITMYFMLTGVQPFKGFKTMEILSARAHDKIKPPEKYVPDLPDPVRRVLGKMLCKDRDQRYLDMDELIEDLEKVKFGAEPAAGKPTLPLWNGEEPPAAKKSKDKKSKRRSNSSPADVNLLGQPLVWVIGVTLLLSVVLIALIVVLATT